MVVQIPSFHKLDISIFRRNLIGKAINSVNQNARKEKIREHNNPLIPKFACMLQAGFNQGEGHARIAHFTPAKAKPFVQHTRNFRHIAIGIGIRCPAPNHYKASLMHRDLAMGRIGRRNRLLHTAASRGDHLGIHAQLPAIADLNPMFGRIGVQHGRDVIFGVHGSKEHTGHGQNLVTSLRAQPIQPVADDRVGKFQIAIFNGPFRRQIGGQFFRQHAKLINGRLAARAVATNHDTDFTHFTPPVVRALRPHCPALRTLSGQQQPQPQALLQGRRQ